MLTHSGACLHTLVHAYTQWHICTACCAWTPNYVRPSVRQIEGPHGCPRHTFTSHSSACAQLMCACCMAQCSCYLLRGVNCLPDCAFVLVRACAHVCAHVYVSCAPVRLLHHTHLCVCARVCCVRMCACCFAPIPVCVYVCVCCIRMYVCLLHCTHLIPP